MEKTKVVKMATVGIDIYALESGVGQIEVITEGPIEIISSSLVALLMNLMASGYWDKDTLVNTVEHAAVMYSGCEDSMRESIEKGVDHQVAHDEMVAGMNSHMAKIVIEKAHKEGILKDVFKSSLEEELKIKPKKIIVG